MAGGKLTHKAILAAKWTPPTKPKKAGTKPRVRIADGDNLYLAVHFTGAKTWELRYRHDGKQQTLVLGTFPTMGAAEARKRAQEARTAAADGEQLTRLKHTAKAAKAAAASNVFGKLSGSWLKREARRKGWTANYIKETTRSVEKHLGKLDGLPVTEITAARVSPLLQKMERKAPAMEEKVHRRLHAILDYAVETGALTMNPLPRRRARKTTVRHFPAVTDVSSIGEVLRSAARADPCKGIQRAHVLLAFTAQRVSEVVGATWDEFDLAKGVWRIPRHRMKKKDADRGPHEVPLPPKLVASLTDWQDADDGSSDFVCPAPRDAEKSITPEGVEKFYRDVLKLSGKHSPHSWRSTFSTICREAGRDGDVVEAQLDHQVGNKVASAYDRAKRLGLRADLMKWYEGTLTAARDGARVVDLSTAKRA